jgi:hypothetical protein
VTDAARLGVVTASIAGLGVLLQLAVLPRSRQRQWLSMLGVGPAAGLALVGSVGTALAVSGIGLSLATVTVGALGLVGLAGFLRRGPSGTTSELERPEPGLASRAVEATLLLALAGVSVVLFRLFVILPLTDWDGWAIWALHAEALFVDGDTRGPVFESSLYAGSHPEYPVLFPVLQALSADAVGRFDVGLIHVVPAAFAPALGLASWGLLRLVSPGPLAALSSLGVVWTPVLIANLSGNYADAVAASLVALGFVALVVWLAGASDWVLLNGALFLCAAGLTKSEGLLFAVATLAGAVAAAGLAKRSRRALVPVVLFATIPPLLLQMTHGRRGARSDYDLALLLDPSYVLANVDKSARALHSFADEVVHSWSGALVLVGLALLACAIARLAWVIVFVGVYVGIGVLGLVATYTAATVDLDWLIATSADRVVFSLALAPALASPALAWLALARVRETAGASEAPTALPSG